MTFSMEVEPSVATEPVRAAGWETFTEAEPWLVEDVPEAGAEDVV